MEGSNQLGNSVEQPYELEQLGVDIFDQAQLEEGLMRDFEETAARQEQQRTRKRIERNLREVQEELRKKQFAFSEKAKLSASFRSSAAVDSAASRAFRSVVAERQQLAKDIKVLKARQERMKQKLLSDEPIDDLTSDEEEAPEKRLGAFELALLNSSQASANRAKKSSHRRQRAETEHERLIRLGHMTPFGTSVSATTVPSSAPMALSVTPASRSLASSIGVSSSSDSSQEGDRVAPHCKEPDDEDNWASGNSMSSLQRATVGQMSDSFRNQMFDPVQDVRHGAANIESLERSRSATPVPTSDLSEDEYTPSAGDLRSSFVSSGDSGDDGEDFEKNSRSMKGKDRLVTGRKRKQRKTASAASKKRSSHKHREDFVEVNRVRGRGTRRLHHSKGCVDDGDDTLYQQRIRKLEDDQKQEQIRLCRRSAAIENGETLGFDDADEAESGAGSSSKGRCATEEDVEVGGGLKIPGDIWSKLYLYQKTGVQWLWELHQQQVGGIVGDEMGLGKTIQMIAFLAALHRSRLRHRVGTRRLFGLGPVLIVCPATVLRQWVSEFHTWYPVLRVAILHEIGSYCGPRNILIRRIARECGVLLTTFSGVRLNADELLACGWHYVVLDEGHKIRNPDAEITLTCKQFTTCHRLILSGSPMQNNLRELWSVFDFVFPGRLGTLPVFMTEFAVPITHGGYACASTVQVQTAYKCVCVLRDTISPYLLRRMKADVQVSLQLPPKNEQVLFCRLTDEQRRLYKQFLDSREVESILSGTMKVFYGLIMLCKISNHPDLCSAEGWLSDKTAGLKSLRRKSRQASNSSMSPEKGLGQAEDSSDKADGGKAVDGKESFGHWRRSGKMLVVHSLLKMWFKQGHRALLFSQTKQMLDILERYVISRGYTYLRMDGGTNINSRQSLITRYNEDKSIFLFLLTTRVGGLGINLTGADRVLIFDPDWNPSTDAQARERAWRIGQRNNVTVYRLLTTGTIEEKIYHRQIFKQFLTNRVLKDPKQRRFFKANDLYELFTLSDDIGFDTDGKTKKKKSVTGSGAMTETAAIFAGMGADVNVPRKRKRKLVVDGEDGDDGRNDIGAVDDNTPEKKRKKKKRVNAEVDGFAIKNLDSIHENQRTAEEKEGEEAGRSQMSDERQTQSNEHDDYILRSLFKKTGILGALQHDNIMQAGDSDYALVQAEADRVAKQAAKALAASRQRCLEVPAGMPTWTGSSGSAGAPGARKPRFGATKSKMVASAENETTSAHSPRFGSGHMAGTTSLGEGKVAIPHSSQLLARMRARNNLVAPSQPLFSTPSSAVKPSLEKPDDLISEVRAFLACRARVDGCASSQELLDEFGTRLPAGSTTTFRSMLKQLCDFSREDGTGMWRLKTEYR